LSVQRADEVLADLTAIFPAVPAVRIVKIAKGRCHRYTWPIMPKEIERKYLVADRSFLSQLGGVAFKQGYIATRDETVVRVRIEGERAVIALKGQNKGIARSEYEYEIPLADAEEMLAELCERPLIEKMRHTLDWAGKTWEVDVFAGENAGLVVAEVELDREDEVVQSPPWIGEEVSEDPRYYNANLVHNPYCKWKEA